MDTSQTIFSAVFAAILSIAIPAKAYASDTSWRVGKSSGAVWVTKSQSQPVSLTNDAVLDAGDSIATGPNGRVLLTRGEERIFVSPNSAIGISAQNADGMRTTITHRVGSILLDVEKKNVQHFEVETPYLAAVVKGTQFRVTVNGRSAKVDVTRGQVQVADFKSGQLAVVLPGQTAQVSARGAAGLSLSGKGKLNPIERGTPRIPSIQALSVPKTGLKPTSIGEKAKGGSSLRKLATLDAAGKAFAKQISGSHKGGLRINAPIGEVKLDFHKVTKGLARGASDAPVYGDRKASVFSESSNKKPGQVDSTGRSTGNGNGGPASSLAASNSPGADTTSGGGFARATGNGNGNGGGSSSGNGINGYGDDDHGNSNGRGRGRSKRDR